MNVDSNDPNPKGEPRNGGVARASQLARGRLGGISDRFGRRSMSELPVYQLRDRFLAMQLPAETIDRTLSEIQRPDDWVGAWNRSAQRFSAEARREDSGGRWYESAIARRNAAMCYHIAHLVTNDDPRTVRALRAAGAQAFSLAAARLYLETRKIGIDWRARQLPAYLAKPSGVGRDVPVIVLLNGASTTKEELLLWAQPLVEHNFSVITLDWPGTGEAVDGKVMSSQCEDMTEGLFAFIENEPGLDPKAVAILGLNLGGVVAVKSAVTDRRIAAVIAITPPFDARGWSRTLKPEVARQLVSLAGQADAIEVLLDDFSLVDAVKRLRTPLLVFGAGQDRVIPPGESQQLASTVGDLATLVWYPDGQHGLYDRIDDWTSLTAEWLTAIFSPEDVSTRVDTPVGPDAAAEQTLEPVVTPEGHEQIEESHSDDEDSATNALADPDSEEDPGQSLPRDAEAIEEAVADAKFD